MSLEQAGVYAELDRLIGGALLLRAHAQRDDAYPVPLEDDTPHDGPPHPPSRDARTSEFLV
jgi:hypothetical protein